MNTTPVSLLLRLHRKGRRGLGAIRRIVHSSSMFLGSQIVGAGE